MRDVLVVEDDRIVLGAVAEICRSEGLRVDEAVNVEEAVAKLYESGYRLAIVDLMLPKESGFHLLRGTNAARRATSTVVISGYATVLSSLESFRLGAFDFLPKPFDEAELLGVVRRALRFGDRAAGEDLAEPAEGEPRYFLGRHSWAVRDEDGIATVGAGESFQGVLGEVARIELPTANDHVTQGQRLVRLAGAEEVYRIWSPLSGRVVATNPALSGEVELIEQSALDDGWLARIAPLDMESERRRLTLRPPMRDAGPG